MNEFPWHPSRGPQWEPEKWAELQELDADVDGRPLSTLGRQADCCVARAAFRVVLAPTVARAAEAELLLCAHHYRASAAVLRDRGARVYDADDRLIPGEFVRAS